MSSDESKSFSSSMLLEESSMLFLYAAAVVSLIAIIVICVCGCRKSIPKNELLGLAGKVKITNPDSSVNEDNSNRQLQTSYGFAQDEIDSILISDIKSRNSIDTSNNSSVVIATATRSLPDLPIDPNRRASSGVDVWDKNGEQNSGGDTGSDLYATVEEHKMAANGRLNKKVSQSTNAVLERGQSGSYASPTTDDSVSPYACYRKEHPYDKVKQEHPYAQVTSASKKKLSKLTRDIQSSLESTTSTSTSRSEDTPAPAPASPLPPIVRTRPASWEAETSSPRDSIPAAGAISGAVAASNELPYMTPPIINTAPENSNTTAQHFSGDSQDSGKGYTCISVREPLSNISRRPTRIAESSHYATLSDDSDETYEAIEEPAQVYTSGSETYAKIAPIARPEVTSPPQLPSVSSLRCGTPEPSSSPQLLHSRQASNSSQASIRNHSPLPKTPEIIDDMYAKVMKMSRKPGGRQRTESLNWSGSSYEEQERISTRDSRSVDLTKPSTSDPYESLTHSSVGYEQINKQRHSIQDEDDMDPNYEKIHRKSSNSTEFAEDIGYAKIHQGRTENDNGYERIHKSNADDDPEANYDMGYERIHHSRAQVEDTYARIHQEDRDQVDVGYEQIHKTHNSDQDSNYDVRYEKIHRKLVNRNERIGDDDDENDPNYEELKTSSRNTIVNDEFDDPNYEVLSSVVRRPDAATEHNYASINKYNKRKYRQSEPNFSKYENNNESTYECMNDCALASSSSPEENKEASSHTRSNSVSRIEVEPNVFYSQVQKLKR